MKRKRYIIRNKTIIVKKSIKSRLHPVITRVPLLDLKRQWNILTDSTQKDQIKGLVVFTFLFSTAYFILPFDVIPDFLLGVGYLDDLTIYAFIREVAYVGAENNLNIKESLHTILRLRVIQTIIVILLIAVFLGTVLYFMSLHSSL